LDVDQLLRVITGYGMTAFGAKRTLVETKCQAGSGITLLLVADIPAYSGSSGWVIAVRHRQPRDIDERSGNSLKGLRELVKINAENADCLEALQLLDASCRMHRCGDIKVREG
jgi:hypothetical protein